MRLIGDIYREKRASGKPVVSFEVFPPKTEEGDRALFERTIPALMSVKPDYCSVTYGAGGSTRDKTLMIVDRIQREHALPTVAHLTCVNSTREEIGRLLDQIRALGVKNLLALRGDPPNGGEFKPTPGGFEYASQLVRFIRERGDFCVGVAGFPEGHIACRAGKYADWGHLKEKIDAGAEVVLTQIFFDNRDYFEFRDHLTKKLGVTVPVVPGLVSILSGAQIKRFTALCGAGMPAPLLAKLEQLGADDDAVAEYGIEYATRQAEELLREGAPGIHFYALNKPHAMPQVMKNLGLA